MIDKGNNKSKALISIFGSLLRSLGNDVRDKLTREERSVYRQLLNTMVRYGITGVSGIQRNVLVEIPDEKCDFFTIHIPVDLIGHDIKPCVCGRLLNLLKKTLKSVYVQNIHNVSVNGKYLHIHLMARGGFYDVSKLNDFMKCVYNKVFRIRKDLMRDANYVQKVDIVGDGEGSEELRRFRGNFRVSRYILNECYHVMRGIKWINYKGGDNLDLEVFNKDGKVYKIGVLDFLRKRMFPAFVRYDMSLSFNKRIIDEVSKFSAKLFGKDKGVHHSRKFKSNLQNRVRNLQQFNLK